MRIKVRAQPVAATAEVATIVHVKAVRSGRQAVDGAVHQRPRTHLPSSTPEFFTPLLMKTALPSWRNKLINKQRNVRDLIRSVFKVTFE